MSRVGIQEIRRILDDAMIHEAKGAAVNVSVKHIQEISRFIHIQTNQEIDQLKKNLLKLESDVRRFRLEANTAEIARVTAESRKEQKLKALNIATEKAEEIRKQLELLNDG